MVFQSVTLKYHDQSQCSCVFPSQIFLIHMQYINICVSDIFFCVKDNGSLLLTCYVNSVC